MDKLRFSISIDQTLSANITVGTGPFWTIKDAKGNIVVQSIERFVDREECEKNFEEFRKAFIESFSK